MTIKKRILKNKNKNTFYKKKKVMKGGEEKQSPQTENEDNASYKPNHSGLLGIFEKASEIFSVGATIVVNKATKMLNLDLSEMNNNISTEDIKQILKEKIAQINDALKDPEVEEQIKELAKTFGEKSSIVVDALAPALKKALLKLIEIVTLGGIKLGQSMIKMILDIAGTVPVMGEVIEAVRVLDDIVRAFQASTEAYLEAYALNADAITETIRRYKDMMKSYRGDTNEDAEGEQRGGALAIKKRITNSISKFHKTNKIHRRIKKQTRKRRRLLRRK
jgi:hypothetical protein